MRIDTDLSKVFQKRTSKKDQKVLDEKAEKIKAAIPQGVEKVKTVIEQKIEGEK